jgi:hypothetical protein
MMSVCVRPIHLGIVGLGLLACSGEGNTTVESQAETSSIQLALSTLTPSGNTYRLGPASFDISGPVTRSVEVTGEESELYVPVDPGEYEVTLQPGWVLRLMKPFLGPMPTVATLVSPEVQSVRVEPFQVAPVLFAFHLGESGIDIGISVEEGVPPGYDGMINPVGDGRFSITFVGSGGACCFDSVSDARLAYPDLNLYSSEL